MTLNRVLLPTFGMPTMPIYKGRQGRCCMLWQELGCRAPHRGAEEAGRPCGSVLPLRRGVAAVLWRHWQIHISWRRGWKRENERSDAPSAYRGAARAFSNYRNPHAKINASYTAGGHGFVRALRLEENLPRMGFSTTSSFFFGGMFTATRSFFFNEMQTDGASPPRLSGLFCRSCHLDTCPLSALPLFTRCQFTRCHFLVPPASSSLSRPLAFLSYRELDALAFLASCEVCARKGVLPAFFYHSFALTTH